MFEQDKRNGHVGVPFLNFGGGTLIGYGQCRG